MSYRHAFGALLITAMLIVGMAGTATAHSWQTEVTVGPMELGISSTPAAPTAGMITEFSGRIADAEVAEGDANRLPWGGVVNTSLSVHINGPDDIHDHTTASIPADDAHFHFSYVFPTDGTYTISVVAELEGEEYAFQFTRDVVLLPAAAQGEEMDALASEVSHVHELAESNDERLTGIEGQLDALESKIEEHDENAGSLTTAQTPGFTLLAAIAALIAIGAFAVGRRSE